MFIYESYLKDRIINLRLSASGIGKIYYPMRLLGYSLKLIVLLIWVFIFHAEIPYFPSLVILYLGWPHFALLLYKFSGNNSKVELGSLLCDTFFAGIVANLIAFSLVPTLAMFTIPCAGNIGVKGLKQFFLGLLALAAGIVFAGLFNGYHFNTYDNYFINLLSGAFLLFTSSYFAYIAFEGVSLLKSAKRAINEQARSVEVQKQVLEKSNHDLKIAKSLIARQNEKLHKYSSSLENQVKERTRLLQEAYNQLMKTSKELDTFIYKASHDVMGPLATVQGLCNLAISESKDPLSLQYFQQMKGVASKMRNTLASLIKLMTIKEYKPHQSLISIPEFIDTILERLKLRASLNGLEIEVDIQCGSILSDFELLEVAVYNIIENAVHYKKTYHDMGSFVRIEVRNTKQDNVKFTIKDNGIGILEESKPLIFEMFYRGTDLSKGSGLGLYMAKTAIEKIGGNINYRRTAASETEFTIEIPGSMDRVEVLNEK